MTPDQAGTSAQRIRIGLTGLAFAFLLVLLGSIISRSSSDGRWQRGERGDHHTNPMSRSPNLGVAPGAGVEANAVNAQHDRRRGARALAS